MSSRSPGFQRRIDRFLKEKKPDGPVTMHDVMKMALEDGFRIRLGGRWLERGDIDGLSDALIRRCDIYDKTPSWRFREWLKRLRHWRPRSSG